MFILCGCDATVSSTYVYEFLSPMSGFSNLSAAYSINWNTLTYKRWKTISWHFPAQMNSAESNWISNENGKEFNFEKNSCWFSNNYENPYRSKNSSWTKHSQWLFVWRWRYYFNQKILKCIIWQQTSRLFCSVIDIWFSLIWIHIWSPCDAINKNVSEQSNRFCYFRRNVDKNIAFVRFEIDWGLYIAI